MKMRREPWRATAAGGPIWVAFAACFWCLGPLPRAAMAAEGAREATVEKSTIGTTPDGSAVDQYTLTNAHGLEVKLLAYGAMLTTVQVPDREGRFQSVTLYLDPPSDYLTRRTVLGSVIGRYANLCAWRRSISPIRPTTPRSPRPCSGRARHTGR